MRIDQAHDLIRDFARAHQERLALAAIPDLPTEPMRADMRAVIQESERRLEEARGALVRAMTS